MRRALPGDFLVAVKVRYFGRLRELLNVKKEEYEVKDGDTLTELLVNYIPERHKKVSEPWRETIFKQVNGEITLNRNGEPLLRNYLILVDGKALGLGYKLRDGDEVVVLPPGGGG